MAKGSKSFDKSPHISNGGNAGGMFHLPDLELISIDMVEPILVLLSDRVLQVVNEVQGRNGNRKDVRIVQSENPAAERDFGSINNGW